MKNKDVFEKTFWAMVTRYQSIFSQLYPAYKSTGFTERNLTNNFVSAFEEVTGKESKAWFEMPTGQNYKGHLDAIVWNNPMNILALIEAKRFSNPEQKISALMEDLKRMVEPTTFTAINLCPTGERYIVLLADVWLENPTKRNTFQNWGSEFVMKAWNNVFQEKESIPFPGNLGNEIFFKFLFERNTFVIPPGCDYGIVAYVAKVG